MTQHFPFKLSSSTDMPTGELPLWLELHQGDTQEETQQYVCIGLLYTTPPGCNIFPEAAVRGERSCTSTPPVPATSLLTDPLLIHWTRRPELTSDGNPKTSQVRMRGEPTCRVTSPLGEDVTLSDSAGKREKVEGRQENLDVDLKNKKRKIPQSSWQWRWWPNR